MQLLALQPQRLSAVVRAPASVRLVTPASGMSTYRFNKHVISHHFCANCGCAPFGFGVGPKGEETAAVNVRCLENVDLNAWPRIPYDGRSV
ncbi:hypothetical protein LMG26858_03638 [Achromobacter anxifer]|uniref:CENP-V/GFA domain-containing protein n=1 Tax=Achromobacter anxifer TaxID=1287737 RepID=A0A6S7DTJ2_9BURK|nr:hypothetical protein LMG26858_03638 [Achromobacter anxifer]